MKGNTPYLVVNGLMKHYGNGEARVQVLDGITTTINKGEICVMLGPSGSGKSTFLNLIGGLEGADGGTIHVGESKITALSAKTLGEYRRRELGPRPYHSRKHRGHSAPFQETPPHRRTVAFAWPVGAPQQISPPGFRRPATALRHRTSVGEEPWPHLVRRTHRCPRLQNLERGS